MHRQRGRLEEISGITRNIAMKQLSLSIVLGFAFGLLGPNEIALANSTRRYDCTIDATDREPIGIGIARTLVSLQYSCSIADGPLKEEGIIGLLVSEWDSEKGRYLASLGVHRTFDGFAVSQLLEGFGSSVMEDNGAVGIPASGTMLFKFASGSLEALSGKTVKFTTKPVSSRQFEVEFTDWPEAAQPK